MFYFGFSFSDILKKKKEVKKMKAKRKQNSKIYHRTDCRYLKHVPANDLEDVDVMMASLKQYQPCKCCLGLHFFYNKILENFKEKLELLKIHIMINPEFADRIEVSTHHYKWQIQFFSNKLRFRLFQWEKINEQQWSKKHIKEAGDLALLDDLIQYIIRREECADASWEYEEELVKMKKFADTHDMQLAFYKHCMYVITEMAAWRIVPKKNDTTFLLFHLPFIDNHVLKTPEIYHMNYHIQLDAHIQNTAYACLSYIYKHDVAKKREKTGNQLAKTTKQQKRYYRQAKNRKKKHEIQKVYDIFKQLEAENGSG